jgi:CubicO group peptidase (beta-lactamase class C family)
LDFYIGLPASVDRNRVALIHPFAMRDALLNLNTVPPRAAAAFVNPFSLVMRATTPAADIKGLDELNRDKLRVLEMPGVNGIGTARSVAKLYGSAATGGSDLGLSPSVREALEGPAVPPTMGVRDKVMHFDTSYSLGLGKPTSTFVFGSSDRAYGWPGAGGSFGFGDPDTGIGFGYVMNNMRFAMLDDPRHVALRQALFRDVLGARAQV